MSLKHGQSKQLKTNVNVILEFCSVKVFLLQILECSLKFLHDWEEAFTKGLISEKEILSKGTLEGLRVTLQSTIQLSKYLLEECNFNYVLTSKFNQDALEVSYNF